MIHYAYIVLLYTVDVINQNKFDSGHNRKLIIPFFHGPILSLAI